VKKAIAIIISLVLNAAAAAACYISEIIAVLYLSPDWHETIIADNGIFHEGPLELERSDFAKGLLILGIAVFTVAALNFLLRIWHKRCGMSVLWSVIPAAVIVVGMTVQFLQSGFGYLFEKWSQTVWL